MLTTCLLNGLTALLSITSTVYFIFGCVGYSDERATIENTHWFKANFRYFKADFGLSSVFVVDTGTNRHFSFEYGDATCDGDFCNRCQSDGRNALGLLSTSLCFSAAVAVMSMFLYLSSKVHMGTQLITTVFAGVSAAFSLMGAGNFMRSCFNSVQEDLDLYDVEWGPGSILSMIGLALMWVALFLQVAALLFGEDTTPAESNSSSKATSEIII